MLLNLVGNAIKFTDAGEVVIKADAEQRIFNLSVRDTGPGISAADQAKLSRSSSKPTIRSPEEGRHRPGARHLQADHRDAWRTNLGGIGLGKGSTFFFTLPVRVERQVETA